MSAAALLPVSALEPNDYNPNHMTDERFAELVEEVKHLGRLPKPVVARPNGDARYTIVDGEHGWRAAQEAGLSEIAVEIVEADDFEARRQTYKRNQHGEHDPVLLGRMFRQMMEERGLSQRIRTHLSTPPACGRRAYRGGQEITRQPIGNKRLP